MIFSKYNLENKNIYFYFSIRLSAIRTEYGEWKKKIDDRYKEINSMNDEEIVRQYKPFYDVKNLKRKVRMFF